MDFEFDIVENREIEDNELTELLTQVYVDGGFTKVEDAKKLFESNSVRDRGFLLGIRERQTNELAGVIILVQPESKARRLAKDNGCLKVIPNSHLEGIIPQSDINNVVKTKQSYNCIAKARDLVLMRPHILHSSSKSIQPNHRRVVHLEFSNYDLPVGLKWT